MKKLFLLTFSAIAILIDASAQTGQLMVKRGSKGLYIEHSVAPKEGLYAIGRLYSVHPKHIAAFNQIELNKGLEIGQIIQIPLSDTNFTQKTKKGQPVYYTVSENEGLTKVSNANNKVSLKDLRNWNALSNDNPPAGTKLIIGFLTVSGSTSTTSATNPPKQSNVVNDEKTAVKTEKPAEKPPVKPQPTDVKTVTKEQTPNQKAVVKSDAPKEQVNTTETKNTANNIDAAAVKPETAAFSGDQGYFKKSFDQQVKVAPVSKNATVTSGVFKTTSGWEDAKYYLLIDGVATGTIVKVTNPDNNKAIYAKVLGEMNGIRQNQGLDVRISNAAASSLGIPDIDKFTLKVNY